MEIAIAYVRVGAVFLAVAWLLGLLWFGPSFQTSAATVLLASSLLVGGLMPDAKLRNAYTRLGYLLVLGLGISMSAFLAIPLWRQGEMGEVSIASALVLALHAVRLHPRGRFSAT